MFAQKPFVASEILYLTDHCSTIEFLSDIVGQSSFLTNFPIFIIFIKQGNIIQFCIHGIIFSFQREEKKKDSVNRLATKVFLAETIRLYIRGLSAGDRITGKLAQDRASRVYTCVCV